MSQLQVKSRNGPVETDMFDVTGFMRILSEAVKYQKPLIFVCCLLSLVAVTWYAFAFPPVFRVRAQMAAERDKDPSRDPFYSNWQVFRKDDPRDEIQFFTSGAVLREVVKRNNLKYVDVHHSFPAHVSYMWRNSWAGKQYQLLSDQLFPDPSAPKRTDDDFGETVEALKDSISFVGEGDSNVATLTVLGPSRRVSDIANSLIDSYLTLRKKRHADEAQGAFDVLNKEVELAKAELDQARDTREAFAKDNGLLIDFQKETQDVTELTALETKIVAHRSAIASLDSNLREMDAQLRNQPEERVVSSTKEINPVREAGKLRRLEQQAALITLREKYREDSPEVREAVANLAKMDSLIAQEPEQIDRSVTRAVNPLHQELLASRNKVQSELEGERSALSVLDGTATQMKQHLTKLPTLTATFLDRIREYDLAKEKYTKLLTRRMEAEVSATAAEAAPASVRVVDYAMPPVAKYWPKLKVLYPAALMIGLALGLVAAVIRVQTSGKIQVSHIKRGRIASPLYATIDIGGRFPALTVVPSRDKETTIPPGGNATPKDPSRAREAGN